MKVRDLDLRNNPVNAEHAELGLPPLENAVTHAGDPGHPVLRVAMWSVIGLLMALTIALASRLFTQPAGHSSGFQLIAAALASHEFWSAVAVGLLVPGMLGAGSGAWLLSSIDGSAMKPFVSAYLLLMGLYVISKVFRKIKPHGGEPRHVAKLGLFGGFVDAVGGGGWGPVVTTTLVGTGHDPRTTIGSVNLAEVFLTFISAGVFALLIDEGPWPTVAGLVVCGLFAAPFAAFLTRRLNTRTLLTLVGTVISGISLYNLYRSLG